MKKICHKCKNEYHFDGLDWGICPKCSKKILHSVRKEKMKQ